MKDKEIIKVVDDVVASLCTLLEVECDKSSQIEKGEEGAKYIKIYFEGEDLGYMIGNHGRHLDSIQYILQIMIGRRLGEESSFRVFVDVGGYRKERDSKLEEMALQKADDARLLGEEIELSPMKPSDRRVVHLALAGFKDIETESVGEGRDRRVVIKPVK